MIVYISPLQYNSKFFLYSPTILLEKNCRVINYCCYQVNQKWKKSGKTQDIKFKFIKKLYAWWDLNLSVLIPPCTLLCSSCHVVVFQVSIWFNMHQGILYQFHWQWCTYGAVPVKLLLSLKPLNLFPTILSDLSSGIKFQQKAIIGPLRLSKWSPAVSPLEVEFQD